MKCGIRFWRAGVLALFAVAVFGSVLPTAAAQVAAAAPREDPLAGDERLARQIAVHIEGLAVRDLLARITQKTGVALAADEAVGDEKVVVFGPARPLREWLADVAALLGGAWRVSASAPGANGEPATGYKLARTAATRGREARLERETTARLIARLDEQVRALRETPEQLARRPGGDAIRERLSDPKGRLGTRFYSLLSRAQRTALFERGRLIVPFAALNDSQKTALRQVFRTIVAEEERFAEEQHRQGFSVGVSKMEDLERGRLRFLLTENDGNIAVLLNLNRTSSGSLFVAALPENDRWLLPARGNPYTRAPVGNDAPLPAIEATAAATRQPGTWTDRLRALAEKTQRPVLADYYRTGALRRAAARETPLVPSAAPVVEAAALDHLCEAPGYLWWTEKDTLLFRKRNWYRQRQYEVPDRRLTALIERLQAQKGAPTYGDVYGLLDLTPRQIVGMNRLGATTGDGGDEYQLAGLTQLVGLFRASGKPRFAPAARLHAGGLSRDALERITLGSDDLAAAGRRGLLDNYLEARNEDPSDENVRRFEAYLFCTYEAPQREDSGYGYVQVIAAVGAGRTREHFALVLPTTLPDDRRDKTVIEVAP